MNRRFRMDEINDFIRKYYDVMVAMIIVMIIGIMVIPVPAWLMDILLSVNITVAVSILLISIYTSSALKIATFPSLLLITTLLRLSLNISSTRLILLNAYAGEVIKAFGQFVVGGNYVVGAVVFLIITVVQFIVIAKGAERVAEVAARFTLDAMPGKQMSIDADMRAGLIDIEDAKKRRRNLERESQFYGAMDGAMKFVKGDAIAGIIIILVNIVGGLLIGVVMKGMAIGDALRTFTLLTIGDGLVSQIPALIISTSAGIVITRVASEDENMHLGKEIGIQLFAQPRALAVTSMLLFGFALVPGLPALPFLFLALLSGVVSAVLIKMRHKSSKKPLTPKPYPANALNQIPMVAPVILELSHAVTQSLLAEKKDEKVIEEMAARVRTELFNELGMVFPGITTITGSSTLAENSFRIYIKEVPVVEKNIKSNADPDKYIAECMKNLLRTHAQEFLGVQEVQAMLDALEPTCPALIKMVIPKCITIPKFTEVLKRLVRERISVKDMKSILETVAHYASVENDPGMLAEYARASLSRYIVYKYAIQDKHRNALPELLPVYLLDPHFEMMVQDSIQRSTVESYLALDPEILTPFLESCKSTMNPDANPNPIILTHREIRYFIWKLLETDFPNLMVLSYQELPPEIQIQPLGRIRA